MLRVQYPLELVVVEASAVVVVFLGNASTVAPLMAVPALL